MLCTRGVIGAILGTEARRRVGDRGTWAGCVSSVRPLSRERRRPRGFEILAGRAPLQRFRSKRDGPVEDRAGSDTPSRMNQQRREAAASAACWRSNRDDGAGPMGHGHHAPPFRLRAGQGGGRVWLGSGRGPRLVNRGLARPVPVRLAKGSQPRPGRFLGQSAISRASGRPYPQAYDVPRVPPVPCSYVYEHACASPLTAHRYSYVIDPPKAAPP